MAKINILSTKNLDHSQVALADSEGIAIKEQEAIMVKPILTKEKWDEIYSLLEQKLEYAVFTSSNAVSALKKYIAQYVNHLPPQWKIFCLSGKTKDLLLENEETFGTIQDTASGAAELAQQVIAKGVKEVVFFCGNRRREELPSILQSAGVRVHEVVVYETEETPVVASGEYDAVLFFSPSAVQSFFSVNGLEESTVCFAIGQTTAKSLQSFTHNPVITSKEPTQESLLDEVLHYYKTR